MHSRSLSKLIHLLISKSIAEALLVTAVAVGFYLASGNSHLYGVLDGANKSSVNGWAVDQLHPESPVEVQLYIDNRFVADGTASEFRPDVHQAERAGDDWHGFVFQTPPLESGEHEARVYAVIPSAAGSRRTLQLIGKALKFRIE
jgi:hypothetical protein